MPAVPDARTRSARLPRSARREQLLGAAQEVFVAQGYHAAAMDDIAERAGRQQAGALPALPGQARPLPRPARPARRGAGRGGPRPRWRRPPTTSSGSPPPSRPTSAFVDEDGGAFRLVFESDLTNEPAVRERVDGVNARLRRGDQRGDPRRRRAAHGRRPELLAVGLTGMAQVAARYWLAGDGAIPRDAAARLLASLSWRGIGGFPRTGEPH